MEEKKKGFFGRLFGGITGIFSRKKTEPKKPCETAEPKKSGEAIIQPIDSGNKLYNNPSRKILTDFDLIESFIELKGKTTAAEAAKSLSLRDSRVLECAQVLEKNNLIELNYPAMGSPQLMSKSFNEQKKNSLEKAKEEKTRKEAEKKEKFISEKEKKEDEKQERKETELQAKFNSEKEKLIEEKLKKENESREKPIEEKENKIRIKFNPEKGKKKSELKQGRLFG